MAEKSSTKTEFPHPYRSLLFALAIGGLLAAIALALIAGTVSDPAAESSTWVWAGHAVTLAIVAAIGELVLAGVLWRAPRRDGTVPPSDG
jgi:uncharacterized membrane protein